MDFANLEVLWKGEPNILAILKVAHDGITPEQFITLLQKQQMVDSMYAVIQGDDILMDIGDMQQENFDKEQSLSTVLESAEIIYGEDEKNRVITSGIENITYRVKRNEGAKILKKCFYGQCVASTILRTSWGKHIPFELLCGRKVGDVIPVTLDTGDATLEIINIQ